jgi:lactam utilization protein B
LYRWTKSETVYSQFETNVRIAATLKSKEFNVAYVKEYARLYQMTAEVKNAREATLDSLLSDYTEIFLYAYVPEQESNDFDKQNSIWTIFVSDKRAIESGPLR